MSLFMELTNESLRPRPQPAVRQTNSITITKVYVRMQYDKGMRASSAKHFCSLFRPGTMEPDSPAPLSPDSLKKSSSRTTLVSNE
ncbi:hypothetical protein NQZ68_013293 [Dissostichus eleginoides]|nr:hypothetical protein NQZ68_013293 [Dissostichus eleginoides]